jgi:hypothetical protein
MTRADLLECPSCEQPALVVEDFAMGPIHDCPDCECNSDEENGLKCLACGKEQRNASADRLAEADEREDAWRAEHPHTTPREFWRQKLIREREKVARLQEGRW